MSPVKNQERRRWPSERGSGGGNGSDIGGQDNMAARGRAGKASATRQASTALAAARAGGRPPAGPPDSTSGRVPSKPIQIKPSKSAWICLFLFGFIWWNRGFSKGYEQKNKKNFPPLKLASRVVFKAARIATLRHPGPHPPRRAKD